VSAVALPLPYPPWGLTWLAWLAAAPLLLACRRSTPRQAALLGLAAGAVAEGLGMSWLLPSGVNPAAFALLTALAGLRHGVFCLGAALVYRQRPAAACLALPTLWVLLEYVRVHVGWLSMPWGLYGYTQYEVSVVARAASVAGVYGVSFVLLAGNSVLAELAHRLLLRIEGVVPARPVGAAALAIPSLVAVGIVAAGNLQTAPRGSGHDGQAATLRVAVVQAGVFDATQGAAHRAAVLERYVRLTREAARQGPDLVVWPESAVPGVIPQDTGAMGILFRLAREIDAHLLVAAGGRDKQTPSSGRGQIANSAFLIGPDETLSGRYDKIRLLPFNEYLPLRGRVTWPSWITSPFPRDATPGSQASVLETDGFRYAVQICWESLFASDARRRGSQDVDFLVTLTNESFTTTPAGYEHLFAMNLFRAVENARPLVRATTTSISAIVGADGRILEALGNGRAGSQYGVIVADLHRAASPSLYTRFGDWGILGLTGISLAALLVRRRAPGRTSRNR
jgi:apolipoprotein N-acyltransferase